MNRPWLKDGVTIVTMGDSILSVRIPHPPNFRLTVNLLFYSGLAFPIWRQLAVDIGARRCGQRYPARKRQNPAVQAQEAPFILRPGETLKLRIFLDRSMLEVFANGRQCVTQRIYPTRADSLGVSLFARGGSALCRSVEAWDMAASNPW